MGGSPVVRAMSDFTRMSTACLPFFWIRRSSSPFLSQAPDRRTHTTLHTESEGTAGQSKLAVPRTYDRAVNITKVARFSSGRTTRHMHSEGSSPLRLLNLAVEH